MGNGGQGNKKMILKRQIGGFPNGPVIKNLPCNAGDTSSILGLGRSDMLQSNKAHVLQAHVL